ncbi:unnamed protein product [Bemisia tabaci]|uniref:Uncharacterized protein n=1 Tax=Bemisia tabaci TaxID=7038 RepID=A0A9P0A7L5_BEMTA|nr:unnamed protein product [Bemisia tabaci]
MQLTEVQWSQIWDTEKECLRKRFYSTVIDDAVKDIGVFCILNVNTSSVKRPKKGGDVVYRIRIDCYCAFEKCRNFVIEFEYRPRIRVTPKMRVRACSCEMKHVGFKTKHCSGAKRVEFMQELRYTKPLVFRVKKTLTTDPDLLDNGNTGDVKSASVIRKIRSEDKKRDDIHPDPLYDVLYTQGAQIRNSAGEESSRKVGYAGEKGAPPTSETTGGWYFDPRDNEYQKKKNTDSHDGANNAGSVAEGDGKTNGQSQKEPETENYRRCRLETLAEVLEKQRDQFCCSDAKDPYKKKCLDQRSKKEKRKINEGCSYLHSVASPLRIMVLCPHRKALYKLKKQSPKTRKPLDGITLKLDATGSIIDIMPYTDKRIYMYSLVVEIDSTVVSISEYYSCDHFIESIENWLAEVYRYMNGGVKRCLAKHISVDCSFALINAACLGINKMSLDIYLDLCYKIMQSDPKSKRTKALMKHLCFIHLCGAHLAKKFVEKIVESYPYSKETVESDIKKKEYAEIKKVLMASLMLIPVEISYDRIKDIFRCIFVLLLAPTNDGSLSDAVQELKKISEEKKKTLEDTGHVHFDLDDIDVPEGYESYKESPYYKDMLSIYEVVENKVKKMTITPTQEQSKYKNERFAKYLLKNYTHILPLWSGLFSLGGERFSNAHVENFYNIVKNWLLRGEGKERANRVLASVEDYNAAQSTLLCRKIPKEGLAGRMKKAKMGQENGLDIDNTDVEESDPDEPKTDTDETGEIGAQACARKRKVPNVEVKNDDEKENCNKKQLPMDVDFEDVYNPDSRETWGPKKRRQQNKYVGRPFPITQCRASIVAAKR